MTKYANLSRSSSVSAFEIGEDSIIVRFKDGGTYLYTYASTGSSDIEHMKKLAARGSGLSSYISTHVKKRYARKIS